MLNKRKVLIGYVTYVVARAMVRMKLRREPPSTAKRIAFGGTAAAAAGATVGGILFWRKRRSGSDGSTGS
jgi:hypothetical protein